MAVPNASYGWTFFLRDYTKEDERKLQDTIQKKCTYGIYKRYKDPITGELVLQGSVEFSQPEVGVIVRSRLPRCSIEPRIDTPFQAADRCKHNVTDYYEHGLIPTKGIHLSEDKQLELVKANVSEGVPMRHYAMLLGLQALRYAAILLEYRELERSWKTTVIWLYGPTGSGKTRKAHELSIDPWLSPPDDLDRWGGWAEYDAHKHVILDNFHEEMCSNHEEFIGYLGKLPWRVPVFGGSRQLLAKQIIITSIPPPHEIYDYNGEYTEKDQHLLMNAITTIYRLDTEGVMHEETWNRASRSLVPVQ